MADNSINSIALNGEIQPIDEQGQVNMSVNLSIQDSDVNERIKLKLGSTEETLKTVDKVIASGSQINVEDSFQDDNAVVLAEALKKVAIAHNATDSEVNGAFEYVDTKARIKHIGNGASKGAHFSFLDTECREGWFTYGLIDAFKEKNYRVAFALSPAYIEQGYGLNVNSTHYDYFTLEQVKQLRDDDFLFCNATYDRSRVLYNYDNVKEEDLRADFKKSLKWFEKNGIKTTAFYYPYGERDAIKTVVRYYEDYAIGSDKGVNQFDEDAFNIHIIPINNTNWDEVSSQITYAIGVGGWIIFKLESWAYQEDVAEWDKNILNNIYTLEKENNIQYLPLDELLSEKAPILDMGTQYDFKIRKNGIVTATFDEKSITGITNQLSFNNLSEAFKSDLYAFCVNIFDNIPATAVKLYVDGEEYDSTMKLHFGDSYYLTYDLIPENASHKTNQVELYITDTTSAYATLEDGKLTISPLSVVTFSDVDGSGENGLTVTESTVTTASINIMAKITNSVGVHYSRFNFQITKD